MRPQDQPNDHAMEQEEGERFRGSTSEAEMKVNIEV